MMSQPAPAFSRDKRIAEQEQQLSSKTDELRNKTTEIEGCVFSTESLPYALHLA